MSETQTQEAFDRATENSRRARRELAASVSGLHATLNALQRNATRLDVPTTLNKPKPKAK